MSDALVAAHLVAAPIPQMSTVYSAIGDLDQPHWYAGYTWSRHEKQVADQLQRRAVECFLPLYETIHRWKNGVRRRLQLPLFPGYVFVRIPLEERVKVLGVPGFVRLVGFNGKPAALPETEVEAMREALSRGIVAEPYPYLTVGQQVEILRGPFQGLRGILLRKRATARVVLSVDLIMRSIVVELDAADVAARR